MEEPSQNPAYVKQEDKNAYKEVIREYLQQTNPKEQIEDIHISALWAQDLNNKAPGFQAWLKKRRKPLAERLAEKTNWQNVVEEIIEEYPIYFDKSGIWWMWNHEKKAWEITDETDICNIVDSVTKKNTLKGSVKNMIIEAFRRAGRKHQPKEIPTSWVQFKDTVVDINTGERIAPEPKYFLTNPLSHNLGASTETPIIDNLMLEWAGEMALTLKQVCAYCCLRDYPLHRIFLLIGSGSNGKGTYLRLMNDFLGKANIASTEMDMLVKNQFHITKLHKKLCCQMSETNFSALTNTSMLKRLSGGDLVGFEYKNKLPFDDYNYAKIVIATNSLPVTHDKTDGFYRRWVIIDFANQYGEKRDVLSEIPEVEYENFGLWCINELRLLLTSREFHKEGSIRDRKERYEKRSNPLQAFIDENYVKDPLAFEGAGFFYDDLSAYLGSRGMRSLTYQAVRSIMKDEGYEYGKEKVSLAGPNPVACIYGLRKKEVKPEKPEKPALSGQYISHENQPIPTGFTGFSGKDEALPTISTLDLVKELFKGKYANQSIPIEVVQNIVPSATDDILTHYANIGLLMESPAGWIRLI